MKKTLYAIGLVVILFLVYRGFINSEQPAVKKNPEELSRLKDQLKNNEPQVKDFVINDAKVLYVSVIDDGTNRDGLASYFCQLANDYNVKLFKVKIVQYGSMNSPQRDNAYGILLGESQCN